MNNLNCGIYRYTNLINGKRYIGKSINITNRHYNHLSAANNKNANKSLLEKAIYKYGFNNFRFEVLEYCLPEELDEREVYWIDYYKTFTNRKDKLGYGYNQTEGGDSYNIGHIPWNKDKKNVYSIEQLNRISEGTKMAMCRPEVKENYINNRPDFTGKNNPFYGKHHTKETKEINRQKHIETTLSKETRELMSLQRLNRVWVHNDNEERFVKQEDVVYYINNNYYLGRHPKTNKKISLTLKK